MRNDDEQIRSLIDQWSAAVHAGDIDGVLADHTEGRAATSPRPRSRRDATPSSSAPGTPPPRRAT